jgi:hypothetical protein
VLASLTVRGRGKQSGLQTTREFWQVWTFRDGKVVHERGFMGREEALEAAGPAEQAMSRENVGSVEGGRSDRVHVSPAGSGEGQSIQLPLGWIGLFGVKLENGDGERETLEHLVEQPMLLPAGAFIRAQADQDVVRRKLSDRIF